MYVFGVDMFSLPSLKDVLALGYQVSCRLEVSCLKQLGVYLNTFASAVLVLLILAQKHVLLEKVETHFIQVNLIIM